MQKRSRRRYLSLRKLAKACSLLVPILLFAGMGCARQVFVKADMVGEESLPEAALKKLDTYKKIKTFKAYAGVEVIVKGRKKTFDMVIVSKLPDMLRMEFLDPLAGTVAVIISTPGSISYTDGSGRSYFTGSESEGAFRRLTRLPWGPEDVIRLLLGGVPADVAAGRSYPVDREGRFWLMQNSLALDAGGEGIAFYEFDGRKLLARVDFCDYKKEGSFVYPSKVGLDVQRGKFDFKLTYKEVEFNGKLGKNVFENAGQ